MNLAMTEADFSRRFSEWIGKSKTDPLAGEAMKAILSAGNIDQSLDLLAIAFAAGYLQCAKDHNSALLQAAPVMGAH